MKIYSRTGDKGTTSLFSGERIEKSHYRVETYGNVDELNANLGVLAASLPVEMASLNTEIRQIQTTLFDIGSWLATTAGTRSITALKKIGAEQTSFLERSIDTMQEQLPELKEFILPGGSLLGAHAHVARTVCRRTERRILKLKTEQELGIDEDQFRQICVFINRLSDYLFTVARYINQQLGELDILWKKG